MLTVRNRAGALAGRLGKVLLAVLIFVGACSSSGVPEQARPATPKQSLASSVEELCQSPQPLDPSQTHRFANTRGSACTNAIFFALQAGNQPRAQHFYELSCSPTTPPDQLACLTVEGQLLRFGAENNALVRGQVPEVWINKIAENALARCNGEWTNSVEPPGDRLKSCEFVAHYLEIKNDKPKLAKAYTSACYLGGHPTKTSDALGGTYSPDYSLCQKAEQLGVKIDRKRAQEAVANKAAEAAVQAQEAARQKEEERQRELEEAEERERRREEDRLERQQMMGAIVAGLSSVAQNMSRGTGRYGGTYTPMSAGSAYSRPGTAAAGPADMRSAQCAAIASQCAAPTAECKGGTMNACYRAAACTCQAAIDMGGCGQDIASLRQCVTKNLSMVQALKSDAPVISSSGPRPQTQAPAPVPVRPSVPDAPRGSGTARGAF